MPGKQPFRGTEIGGLGNVGEHVGDPRRYRVDPDTGKLVLVQLGPPEKGLGPGKPSTRKVIEDEVEQLTNIYSRTAPDQNAIITPNQVGVAIVQIDSGISGRTSILISNMSNVVIWVNTHPQGLGVNRGIPLAANAPAGGFNGGTLSMDVSEHVKFWAVAAGGAGNLVVVVESAR